MFSSKMVVILNLIGLCSAGIFSSQATSDENEFLYKRNFEDLMGMDSKTYHYNLGGADGSSPAYKRSFSQQDMCERTSAMFAIRACRAYCIKNYEDFPSQCGVPGAATTVVEMASQMRKMVTLEYCQNQYDIAIQKCLKMLA